MEQAIIREIVKREEFISAKLDVFKDRRVNIWSKDIDKIDNVLKLVLQEIVKQKYVNYKMDSDNKTLEDDSLKVLFFTKNKNYFDTLNLPKGLFLGDRILTSGDEEVLRYLLSNIVENASNEKFYNMLEDYENKEFVTEELKNELNDFFDNYDSKSPSKRPKVYVLIDDLSVFYNDIIYEIYKKIFNLSRHHRIYSYFGCLVDNNIKSLAELSNADKTLIDKLNDDEMAEWSRYNGCGLGNISKLDRLSNDDFLCFNGNLLLQWHNYGSQPYIVGIVKDMSSIDADKNIANVPPPSVFRDEFSLLKEEPRELVEYKYALQDEHIKYMTNFADIRKVVVKDFKSLLIDYIEFDGAENYDVLRFVDENFIKIRGEFSYRMAKHVQKEDYRRKEMEIEKCFSLGRNLEIMEYIKIKPREYEIKYNWLTNTIMLIKIIVELWNLQNVDCPIGAHHFYKYAKDHRQKYGYTDEWCERDLVL